MVKKNDVSHRDSSQFTNLTLNLQSLRREVTSMIVTYDSGVGYLSDR